EYPYRRRLAESCSFRPRLVPFDDLALDVFQRVELLLELRSAALLAQALADLGIEQSRELLHRAGRLCRRHRLKQARGLGLVAESGTGYRQQQGHPHPAVGATILGEDLVRSVQFALLFLGRERRDFLGVGNQLHHLTRLALFARGSETRTGTEPRPA